MQFHCVSLLQAGILKHSASLDFGFGGRVGLEGKRPFGIHRQRYEDFMETRMVGCGLELVAGLCDYGNELFGFIKCAGFLCQVRYSLLLKADSANRMSD
jgi:hypothetical protein